jgi:Nucleotidyl transferase AbiEii toxin, Type IV TA system
MHSIPQSQIVRDYVVPMPSLLHLAAMKFHALAQRNKRKDYVDLAFISKQISITSMAEYTKNHF